MASSNTALLGAGLGVAALLGLLAAAGKQEQPKTPAAGTPPAPSSGTKPPATTPPATTPPATGTQQQGTPPQAVLDRIIAAVSSTDPEKMRAEATRLESEGWVVQAGDLRRAADIAAMAKGMGGLGIQPLVSGDDELAGDELVADLAKIKVRIPQGGLGPVNIYAVPAEPIAASPLPGVIKAEVSPASANAARIQAQKVVNELDRNAPQPGQRNDLVRQFQSSNGLKPSGYYGPATALLLATRFGLIPPTPVAWPTKGRKKAKANYRDALLAIAAKDPQRAEEFTRAARNV